MAAQMRTKNKVFEPCKKVITPEAFQDLLEVEFSNLKVPGVDMRPKNFNRNILEAFVRHSILSVPLN